MIRLVAPLSALVLPAILAQTPAPSAPAPPAPGVPAAVARLKIGDQLSLTLLDDRQITGDYTVQSDGAIYVPRVGAVRVVGRTVADAQATLKARFRAVYRDPAVYLALKRQRASSVFVVGGGGEGLVDIAPGADLRQVFAQARTKEDNDLLRVSVFRRGVRIASVSAADLASGRPGAFDGPVEANDVVVISPVPYIRVWITGTVRNPGRFKLTEGEDVYRAIAQAGELGAGDGSTPVIRAETTVTVRRGPQTFEVPLVPKPGERPLRLEDGDTVTVEPAAYVRVTVAGEVARPGDVTVREGTPIVTALSAAGGVTTSGTARNVYLFRDGEARVVDATGARDAARPLDPVDPQAAFAARLGQPLRSHDIVFVPRNERAFYVFGSVEQPSRYLMQDNRVYRLADAVAEARVSREGTIRRVYLMRPDETGTMRATLYHLDDYVKSGKPEANPVVEPNDVVFVEQTRPNGISVLTQAASGLILFNALRR